VGAVGVGVGVGIDVWSGRGTRRAWAGGAAVQRDELEMEDLVGVRA